MQILHVFACKFSEIAVSRIDSCFLLTSCWAYLGAFRVWFGWVRMGLSLVPLLFYSSCSHGGSILSFEKCSSDGYSRLLLSLVQHVRCRHSFLCTCPLLLGTSDQCFSAVASLFPHPNIKRHIFIICSDAFPFSASFYYK